MDTNDDVFRNMFANDPEHDDDISQLLRDVESGFLSARQMKKLDNEKGWQNTIVFGLPSEQIGSWPHAVRVEIYALI